MSFSLTDELRAENWIGPLGQGERRGGAGVVIQEEKTLLVM
jgi:hypothetical protein